MKILLRSGILTVIAVTATFVVLGVIGAADNKSYTPKDGFVPNADTAIAIALAVWGPIYGEEHIEQQSPYRATLSEGVWTVTGTLPENVFGGTAVAEIAKQSGCVLRVYHER